MKRLRLWTRSPSRRASCRSSGVTHRAVLRQQFTISIATAILTEASLGYLGLGVPPPAPTWGSMLATGKAYVETSVWPSVVPGVCIMLTVLGFNLLGDSLRDALDPRTRNRR
ncbi:MAG: ABC transporter permease subunit [Ilumatobacteraceae bacterium]|nr:ABC transporter permease subunit [Ilumatobacteraceae bacterium]